MTFSVGSVSHSAAPSSDSCSHFSSSSLLLFSVTTLHLPLCHILHIPRSLKKTAKNPHYTPSSAQAQCCCILHAPSSNSSLLRFTHPLFSLHGFCTPVSLFLVWIYKNTGSVWLCVCGREKVKRKTTWGYYSDPYFISQRSGWNGALPSFLSFLPVTLKLLCLWIQAQ